MFSGEPPSPTVDELAAEIEPDNDPKPEM